MVSLGIDLGTTSVKVCLVDGASKTLLQCAKRKHYAAIRDPALPLNDEQDPNAIRNALELLLQEDFDTGIMSNVSRITFTGQMHGVMLWKSNETLTTLSNLITWQDLRCTKEVLAELPRSPSGCPLASGYGCATLFWLKVNRPHIFEGIVQAGTIMDYFVTMLCGLGSPIMSSHNARSWGYHNMHTNCWEIDLLAKNNFPVDVLPKLAQPHETVGQLQEAWNGVPKGTAVSVGLADFQCTVYSSIGMKTDAAVLHIGTSSQLAVIPPNDPRDFISLKQQYPAVEISPYFGNKFIVFVAALTGGNAVQEFVDMLHSWMLDLGIQAISKDSIYSKVESLASSCSEDSSLHVCPTLYGERHVPDGKGFVHGITRNAIKLDRVSKALYRGIVTNAVEMMPPTLIQNVHVKSLILTGNLLVSSKVMQSLAREILDLPISVVDSGDAAYGAALRGMSEWITA